MIIHYDTIEEMVNIIEHLVRKGLTFEVNTMSSQIKLGEGY
jgi:hypothetical protein